MLTGETNDGEWIVACMRVSQKGEGIWGAVSVGVVATAVVVVVTGNRNKNSRNVTSISFPTSARKNQELQERGSGERDGKIQFATGQGRRASAAII